MIRFYIQHYPTVYAPLLERRRNKRVVFYTVLCEKYRTQTMERKEVIRMLPQAA